MISTDRDLFIENSRVAKRFLEYSKIFEHLDVIVFTKKGFEKKQLTNNVTIYPTNSLCKINYISDAIKMGIKLKSEVVSSQDAFLTGLSARKISELNGAKLHIQIHSDIFSANFYNHSLLNKIHVFVAKILLSKVDGIRVVSKRIANSLNFLKLKTDPVVLPIFTEELNDSNENLKKNFVYNILTIARLEKEKNVLLAIESFYIISKQRNDVGMIILGSGSLENNLKDRVKDLGISDRVLFVKNENVANYLNIADIYIQTSKYEGYGMALIEAALKGLPIVSTDVGIIGEVLIDGGSVLTAKSDASDFAVKINTLLDDESLRSTIGARAKEIAQNHVKTKEQYLSDFKKAFEI